MFFYILYIISLICLLIPIFKIINYGILRENTTFLLLTNYILNITSAIFFGYFQNYLFATLFLIALLIFACLLIKEFKNLIGFYELLSIPYLLVVSYSCVFSLIMLLQSI
ncbi:MAG TPA: tryptophan-rich sensory protein [Candidatus Onthocola stercorigallinarum]|nr:tryptophan-rich sensory protein [Candidatus Onthocola stercorigallinarum]